MSLAGCGDTFNEYNYYYSPTNSGNDAEAEEDADASPDADLDGPVPDAESSDAGPDSDLADAETDAEADAEPDAEADTEADAEADACVPSLAPLSCEPGDTFVEGILSESGTVRMGNLEFAFGGIHDSTSGVRAVVDLLDNCGNTLTRLSFNEGTIYVTSIEGASYTIRMISFYASDTDPWAFISVGMDCWYELDCEVMRGVVFPGEILLAGETFGVRLDDLMAVGAPAAIVSLVNMSNPEPLTLANYVVPEGVSVVTDYGLSIRANAVAAGYSYEARWADLSVHSEECE